jgi:DNA repair exonuclease SbcCD nuclease subunit
LFKKAAVFTDIHQGLKSNSKLHNQDCEDYIDWFIETSKKNNCDVAIFCGDWTHNRNSINLTTLSSSIRNLELLSKNFDKVYMFAGNHDLYFKDKRDVKSIEFAKHIENITIIDEIYENEDVAFIPWLVGDEWKRIPEIKSKYMFGHFELPSFYMNAMVQMPDHGGLNKDHFVNQKYVFSGHFHKRQIHDKVHYIGNCFPHNYSDSWDDDRGMMILDRENDKEPVYINWKDAPKYRALTLSKLLNDTDNIIKPKMHLRITLDIKISFEEASFLKETFMEQYSCRDVTLIQMNQTEDLNSDLDITNFASVGQIVTEEILQLDTTNYDKKVLLEIYKNL